jgi:hypothetical protein
MYRYSTFAVQPAHERFAFLKAGQVRREIAIYHARSALIYYAAMSGMAERTMHAL